MGKRKNNLILINSIFFLFFSLYAIAIQAETEEDAIYLESPVSINEEVTIPDSVTQDIQLEQYELVTPETNASSTSSTQEKKSAGQGKSILNVTGTKPSPSTYSPKRPKTALEAGKLGWKQMTVKTPQPISKLIKEVPKEIEAKKARLKKTRNTSSQVK